MELSKQISNSTLSLTQPPTHGILPIFSATRTGCPPSTTSSLGSISSKQSNACLLSPNSCLKSAKPTSNKIAQTQEEWASNARLSTKRLPIITKWTDWGKTFR